MKIEEINKDKKIDQFFIEHWHSDFIISKGKRLYGHDLNGFIVYDDDKIIGLLTYDLEDNEAEIVSLDSLKPKKGIGTALIGAMINRAKELKLSRIWLLTTNDNIDAMKFYQKRGFVFKAVYPDAIKESRKLGQIIPDFGFYGLPIRDEIECEYRPEIEFISNDNR